MANKKHVDFNAIERFFTLRGPVSGTKQLQTGSKKFSFGNDQLMKDMRKVIVSKDRQRMWTLRKNLFVKPLVTKNHTSLF